MNIYRLVADMSHVFAILILLFKIWKSQSCAGISGKSQLLMLLVFLTRYLDLFTYFVSYYNTFMKLLFIGSTALTVFFIFVKYRSTYNSSQDTFRMEILLLGAAGLAFWINHEFSALEILWTFSIYLEAVAILPQFFMIHKTGEMEMFTYHYLFALGLYRAFYIFNWVYRYSTEYYFDSISFLSGCVQTAFYCYFLYTKEFLKRQARAHFLHFGNGKADGNAEKSNEVIAVLVMEDVQDDKSTPPVYQLQTSILPGTEEDGGNRTVQQPDSSASPAVQPIVENSTLDADLGASDNLSSFTVGELRIGEVPTCSTNQPPQTVL